jgi:hypothetical protein
MKIDISKTIRNFIHFVKYRHKLDMMYVLNVDINFSPIKFERDNHCVTCRKENENQ